MASRQLSRRDQDPDRVELAIFGRELVEHTPLLPSGPDSPLILWSAPIRPGPRMLFTVAGRRRGVRSSFRFAHPGGRAELPSTDVDGYRVTAILTRYRPLRDPGPDRQAGTSTSPVCRAESRIRQVPLTSHVKIGSLMMPQALWSERPSPAR